MTDKKKQQQVLELAMGAAAMDITCALGSANDIRKLGWGRDADRIGYSQSKGAHILTFRGGCTTVALARNGKSVSIDTVLSGPKGTRHARFRVCNLDSAVKTNLVAARFLRDFINLSEHPGFSVAMNGGRPTGKPKREAGLHGFIANTVA